MRLVFPSLLPAVPLLVLASPAVAHDGHATSGVMTGLMHPVIGLDHLLATLGVGLVIGLASRGAGTTLQTTAAGLSGLLAGLLAAVLALGAPGSAATLAGLAEPAAVLGLLVLAGLVLRAESLGRPVLGLAVALVSLPHALLHIREGAGLPFFAGLAMASLALLVAGHAAGRRLGATATTRSEGLAGAVRLALATGLGMAGLTGLGLLA